MAHNHKEAYMLMNYRCECGHHELIWNSRDGVTPFPFRRFILLLDIC